MVKEVKDLYEMSLIEIRDHRGLSRRETSRLTGVSEDTLYSIEKRKTIPRVDTAIAISEALNISLKQFCHSIGLDVGRLKDDYVPTKTNQNRKTTDN